MSDDFYRKSEHTASKPNINKALSVSVKYAWRYLNLMTSLQTYDFEIFSGNMKSLLLVPFCKQIFNDSKLIVVHLRNKI